MTEETIVQFDPNNILADDNSRFSLKPTRIEALAGNILEVGGVLSPVEVEAIIPEPKKGPTHRLTAGFYRHAAVGLLNTRDKAGLMLPAIVRSPADALERLRHQIVENVEREDMSPMDTAVAIKRLIDAGVPKPDVRKTFARPGSVKQAKGVKAGTVQLAPMSNAMLNIYLSFLDLPKGIQTKIHEGTVGVAAAYELGKVAPEKRAAVIERAEADRLAALSREEKDEEKYLNSQKKAEEAKGKVAEALAAVEESKEEVVLSEKKVAEKLQDLRAVQAEQYDPEDTKARSAYMEKLHAAEADHKAAVKLSKDAKNKVAKALEARNKAEETAAARAAEADSTKKAAREGKSGRGKSAAIGPKQVQNAAKAEGENAGNVPLNLSEIRSILKEVASGQYGADDRVAAVAKQFKSCFDGVETPKLFVESLNALLDAMGCTLPKKVAKAKPAPAVKA